jgi:hypothetical protein
MKSWAKDNIFSKNEFFNQTLLRCRMSKMKGHTNVIITTAATSSKPASACKSERLMTATTTKHATVSM